MSHDPQERSRQAHLAAMSTILIVVFVVIASSVGHGIWAAIPFAAVGLAVGLFFAVRALKQGGTRS